VKDLDAYYPQTLRDLADVVAQQLVDAQVLDEARARQVGRTVADRVCEEWQGQIVTVPKAALFRVRKRWQEIYERFTGNNHAELAREYGMGVRQIYKVIAVMRAEYRARASADLFEGSGESNAD
jgi:Mor family transcriptional regulator